MTKELFRLPARDVASALRNREITSSEVLESSLARIEATNPSLNSIVTLCADRAREKANFWDKKSSATLLGGLPVAIKDLSDVAGVRTTYGSRAFADHVPTKSDILVETLEQRGAVVIGKTNTPEFGSGGLTFNELFGKTLNPWDTTKNAGGSSGGAAAAVASGQVWLATASDLGGSIRLPASFCGVVGFRPTPGVVARGPATNPFDTLWVEGPIARDVLDVALMLDAMSGEHPGDPLSVSAPEKSFLTQAAAKQAPRRVAYSNDLGQVPVASEVRDICAAAALKFDKIGAQVDGACPDFCEALECFRILRAALYVDRLGPLVRTTPELLRPDVIWNTEQGFGLSSEEISEANRARGRLTQSMASFFENHDILACPTVVVPAVEADLTTVKQVEGREFKTYFDWIFLTFAISLTGCPAISIPCGKTKNGLPVGLQLVGRPHSDGPLLSAAAALEDVIGFKHFLADYPGHISGRSSIN